MSEVTRILNEVEQGNPQAVEKLLPLVYDELRKLAASKLASERLGHTLQPTALVHEAYLRLVGSDEDSMRNWDSRGHFFSAAAEAMRRILVESARARNRLIRGGNLERQDLKIAEQLASEPDRDILAVDEALALFAQEQPLKAELVKLRFFAGLTIEEAAQALNISPTAAKRHWRYARARLAEYLREDGLNF